MANENAQADYQKFLSLPNISDDAQISLKKMFEIGKQLFAVRSSPALACSEWA